MQPWLESKSIPLFNWLAQEKTSERCFGLRGNCCWSIRCRIGIMADRKPANLSSRIVATASGTDADDELGRVGEGDNAILPAFKIWTVAGSLTPASRDPQTLPNRFLLINPLHTTNRPRSPGSGGRHHLREHRLGTVSGTHPGCRLRSHLACWHSFNPWTADAFDVGTLTESAWKSGGQGSNQRIARRACTKSQ